MMFLKPILALTLPLFVLLSSPIIAENQAIAQLFEQANLKGTLVLSSLKTGKMMVHNDKRAHQRLSPASTFKIPNTLIALETQTVDSIEQVFAWDGHQYSIPAWNQDQTLRTAFKSSCVWFYQKIAKQVGSENYQYYLKELNYGNQNIEPNLTTFWLGKGLRITPVEQVEFLKKTYLKQYAISEKSYQHLRMVMQEEQNDTYTLYAKTGWKQTDETEHGWYVGYIETPQDVWFFATNLLMENGAKLAERKTITMAALKQQAIL